MYNRVASKIVLIVLVIAACVYFAYPPEDKLGLGTDLAGGTLLELSVSDPDARDSVIEALRKRQDNIGMKGIEIIPVGTHNIQIIAPSSNSADIEAILKQSVLEFCAEAPEEAKKRYAQELTDLNVTDYTKGLPDPKDSNYTAYVLTRENKDGTKSHDWILVESGAKLTGSNFTGFGADTGKDGKPVVAFQLETSAAQEFGDLTAQLIETDRKLAIILDGKCISAPGVNEPIRGGRGIITLGCGDNAEIIKQQKILLTNLNAGALKTPITVLSVRTTSATLGAASVEKGARAIIIGLLAVLSFMAIYYWGAGLVANFALVLNLIILLGLLCVFEATFSLLGIASLILTIGMAIDANILVFERIREEMNSGKALKGALASGYKKAFSTIIDANITTVGTAAILLWFSGSGPIKSFAIVLIVGIIASMFTALFVTRTIFTILMRAGIFRRAKMMQAFKRPNFQFGKIVRYTKFVSIIVIVLGVGFFIQRGSQNFGIDFLGGGQYRIGLTSETTAEEMRDKLHELAPDFKAPEVLQMEAPEEGGLFAKEFVVRISFSGIQAIVEHAGKADTLSQDQWVEYVKKQIVAMFSADFPYDPFVKDEQNTRYSEIDLKVFYNKELGVDEKLAKERVEGSIQKTKKDIEQLLGTVPAFNLIVTEAGPDYARYFKASLKGFKYSGAKESEIQNILRNNIEGYFTNKKPKIEFVTNHELDPNAVVRLWVNFQVPTAVTAEGLAAYQNDVLAKMLDLHDGVSEDAEPFWGVDVEGISGKRIKGVDPKVETVEAFRYLRIPLDISARLGGKETPASLIRKTKMALNGKEFAGKVTENNYPISLSPGGMSAADEFKPSVARNLRLNAFYAITLALAFIVVYIWFRFRKISFGIAAVVALVHDVLIALAAIAIFDSIPGIDVKFDMPIVAALLTIIGYSLNDTIVVFDRIRENMGLHRDERYYTENINNSINQTLSRTIWTSATTFFVALSLAVLGGESLRGFAVILCVGVVVGTYSSIFIASPVVSWLHNREIKDKSVFVSSKKKNNAVGPE